MNETPDANELRAIARHIEETALSALANYSSIPVPLRSGDLKEFPRPSREDQAAEQGFTALRTTVEQAVTSLYALAFAFDHGLDVPSALFMQIQPYIESFRHDQFQRASENDSPPRDTSEHAE